MRCPLELNVMRCPLELNVMRCPLELNNGVTLFAGSGGHAPVGP